MVEKYNTDKTIQSLIDAKKVKIWEILCDSKSIRMKGSGDFPQKLVNGVDRDIDELTKITEKLKY